MYWLRNQALMSRALHTDMRCFHFHTVYFSKYRSTSRTTRIACTTLLEINNPVYICQEVTDSIFVNALCCYLIYPMKENS